ncbi:hypothetical protein VNI00_009996 [Paramarasmius palmivorus]|uniref:Conserved oligomeric Golgi complex subunit 8 n=1 Tax=Paramarasmius palmivorus TaxID=297713 RepID=A0AAW0CPQ8_9AGAR
MAETVTGRDHVPEDSEGVGITLAELFSSTEPSATQSHHLTSSLTSLTHTSYPTFISLHTTTSALTSSLRDFSSSLDALINQSLPALEESSTTWREHTDNVLSERRKARVVLEQHDKIRDLLDIPLLIDTCVRNGYFSEASFPGGTCKINISLVLHTFQNTAAHTRITTLHEPNRKLPALWKAVNFIRKMDAFRSTSNDGSDEYSVHAEEQLALAFLAGREQCLVAALDSCKRDIMRLVGAGALQEKDRSDLAEHLRRYIDLWRKEVSDIVAQYTSIFLDHLTSDSAKKSTTNTSTTLLWRVQTLITTYTLHNLETHLIPLLSPKLTLSRVPLPLMQSILKPLTFCCNSFARIGMDFRGILSGLFSEAVSSIVTDELSKHSQAWIDKLTEKTGSRTTAPTPKRLSVSNDGPIEVADHPDSSSLASASAPTEIREQPSHVPPPILSTYPPLAIHTNAILTTFNNLRLIAPTAILKDLQNVLDKEVVRCGQALSAYIKCVFEDPALKSKAANGYVQEDEESVDSGPSQEERVALAVGEVFFKMWVPFVRRALGEGVYGVKKDYSRVGSENGVANGDAHAGTDHIEDRPADDKQGREGSHELAQLMREWESWLEGIKR